MDHSTLQAVALEVASARSLDRTLHALVSGLAEDPDTALARIWLIAPGRDCDTCAMRAECPGHVDCLHLVASAGRSRSEPDQEWTRHDGRFRRFPLGRRKVGRIAASGEALLYGIEDPFEPWIADSPWVEAEGVRAFAGQPLVFRDEVLGVLALFRRSPVDDEAFGWLRTFADQAAVAIANARAFDEVETLRTQLELERDYLREERGRDRCFLGLVGESPALRRIEQQIEAVAPTEASVLIQGESGTGKELIANAIHTRSARSTGPIVQVNCAAIPAELFESEFFGHARGAFTGALAERAGRFQIADGGTLFLDEVGEIPLELQGKLLRVLQEGSYSRVGEDGLRTSDVRLVAATNKDLLAEVEAGRFRQDLYYRLSVFPIVVPPLRERIEDIVPLAQHFLRQATTCKERPPTLTRSNARQLEAYHWPGNAREMRNVIERALILANCGRLNFELEGQPMAPRADASEAEGPARRVRTDAELRAVERENALAALDEAGGKIAGPGGAAELLGLNPTTLRSRFRAMGIDVSRGARRG